MSTLYVRVRVRVSFIVDNVDAAPAEGTRLSVRAWYGSSVVTVVVGMPVCLKTADQQNLVQPNRSQ